MFRVWSLFIALYVYSSLAGLVGALLPTESPLGIKEVFWFWLIGPLGPAESILKEEQRVCGSRGVPVTVIDYWPNGSDQDFVSVVLSIREKLEDNLVNAMDSTEADCETAEDKSVLMFKIASKSKNLLSISEVNQDFLDFRPSRIHLVQKF